MIKDNKVLFYVGSEIQKALFIHEIQGQISDGLWENRRPDNHWEFWSGFENDDVIVDSIKRGRTGNRINGIYGNGYCSIDKYNLLKKDLIDAVGDRMLFIAKLFKVAGDKCKTLNHIPKSADCYFYYSRNIDSSVTWYKTIIDSWDEAGFTYDFLKDIEADNSIMTMLELKKELKELRSAMACQDMLA